jgi:hypothetical protein
MDKNIPINENDDLNENVYINIKLNKEEITECVSNASYNVHSKVGTEINGHKVYVQYTGTNYGDDCQTNISEVE